jgi:hypothetical protein
MRVDMMARGKKSLVGMIVALVYFVFAAMDLWGWFTYHGQIVALTARDSGTVWVAGRVLSALMTMPTPGILFWVKFAASRWLHRPVLQFGVGGLVYHLSVATLAVALGYGFLRGRSWARWGLTCLSLLAGAVNLVLLARMLHARYTDSPMSGVGALWHAAMPVFGLAVAGMLLFFLLRSEAASS